MPVFDLFSKRRKRERGEVPDAYQYEEFPQAFRVQVTHVLRDAFGNAHLFQSQTMQAYEILHNMLCREYGEFRLSQEAALGRYDDAVFSFLLKCQESEKVLDIIEAAFRLVEIFGESPGFRHASESKITPKDAVEELNIRFLEHGIGYQFEASRLIRMDSTIAHAEIVKPGLKILSEKPYSGANEEFLRAFDHYKDGLYPECLNECLKAFESTMKSICQKRGWAHNQTDTAQKLLGVCFENDLIPPYLQSHFTALRSSLESGVPTVRNKVSGHGQGTQQVTVPRYLAGYMLRLTATSILLLTEAEKELR